MVVCTINTIYRQKNLTIRANNERNLFISEWIQMSSIHSDIFPLFTCFIQPQNSFSQYAHINRFKWIKWLFIALFIKCKLYTKHFIEHLPKWIISKWMQIVTTFVKRQIRLQWLTDTYCRQFGKFYIFIKNSINFQKIPINYWNIKMACHLKSFKQCKFISIT